MNNKNQCMCLSVAIVGAFAIFLGGYSYLMLKRNLKVIDTIKEPIELLQKDGKLKPRYR